MPLTSVQANTDTGTTLQDHPAIGPDGTYLNWDDARDGNANIYFSRRDALTGAWSTPNTKVNNDGGTRIQLNPSISVDASGNAYALWQDERNGVGKPDIYYSKRATGQSAWSANAKVNNDSGGGGGAVQRNVRIAGKADGDQTAVWVDLRSNQNNIWSSTLTDGIGSWAANKQVTDNPSALKDFPDVVLGPDGTSYAVWQDSRSGNADIYFATLAPGGANWSTPNLKISDDPGSAAQRSPRIAIDGSGTLTVVFLDDRTTPTQVRAVRKTAGGSWSSSVVVSDAAARPLAPLGFALRADGVAQVAWSDNRAGANTDIYTSQYSSGAWSTSALLSDDPGTAAQSSPALAYVGGELASAWRDDRGGNGNVRARRPAGDHFAYSYDGLNRLTGVSLLNAESFALDGASNVTKRSGVVETYDAANRLTADGGTTNTWSNADRLTLRGADIFEYDALDRLKNSTVGGSARIYTYNGDGLLQSRTGAGATSFLWDPATSPSRELRQGSDNVVYGLGPLYAVKADASTLTFARDGGKSVRAQLSAAGSTTASFRYKAYGQIAQSNGAAAPSYLGYAGQLLDPSGLYYMRARWYDSVPGRFLSRDALAGSAASPVSLNAFGYGGANPVLRLDPSGLRATGGDENEFLGNCDAACVHSVAAARPCDANCRMMSVLVGTGQQRTQDDGVVFVTSGTGILGALSGMFGVPMTFSDGLVVSAAPAVNNLTGIDAEDADHEYGHIPQARALGLAFSPAYILLNAYAPITMVSSQVASLVTPGRRALGLQDWHDAHPMEWHADMHRPNNPTNIYANPPPR